MAPFAAGAVLAFGTLLAHPDPADPREALLALGITVAVLAATVTLPWRGLPAWTRAAPALAFLVVLVLLREAAGGSASGFAPLAMLSVFWLAIYGSRVQLLAGLVAMAVTFLAPPLLIGGPDYPLEEWRRAVLWVAIGAVAGLSVQGPVRELRMRRRRDQEHSRTLATVAEAIRSMHGADARFRVCEAARSIASAAFVLLLEPDGGDLVITAQAGSQLAPERLRIDGDRSGAVSAYTSGERLFVADSRGHEDVSQRMVDALGSVSVLFEPALQDEEVVGVLVVGWRREVAALGEHQGLAVALLASEAGAVMERADLLGRLEALALRDPLTGLPNRRAWEDDIEREHARARRGGGPLAVAMLDLDRFKRFNDSHGHQVGDRLLQDAAAAWRRELRDDDVLARYGGEEFVLALGADRTGAIDVVERLRAVIPRGQTCSAGVAVWDGSEDAEALIGRADQALYEAKRLGRDRVEVDTA